jgi:S1-C subfamily serine protease
MCGVESSGNTTYILAMSPQMKPLLANIGAIGIIVVVFLVLVHPQPTGVEPTADESGGAASPIDVIISTSTNPSQPASAGLTISTTTTPAKTTKVPAKTNAAKQVEPAVATPPLSLINATTSDNFKISRTENPYPFPPKGFAVVNEEARAALVNILCAPRNGSLRPTSASGVIIDPRGIVLTNAHVGQYVLLASDQNVDLSCVIRAGSPAVARFIPEVLYIPSVWIEEHAKDIKTARPLGTGEHDYALLRIRGTLLGSPLPSSFPSLPIDLREAVGFVDDQVLVASYPAEFIGGMTAQLGLYPVTSITTIKGLLTFSDRGTVDLVSVGGVIGAQSGSSGGAIVNAWGRLIGIISTTSEGVTTDERDLRAVTLSYINRDIHAQSGLDLNEILAGDVVKEARAFNTIIAPALLKLLTDQIKPR